MNSAVFHHDINTPFSLPTGLTTIKQLFKLCYFPSPTVPSYPICFFLTLIDQTSWDFGVWIPCTALWISLERFLLWQSRFGVKEKYVLHHMLIGKRRYRWWIEKTYSIIKEIFLTEIHVSTHLILCHSGVQNFRTAIIFSIFYLHLNSCRNII